MILAGVSGLLIYKLCIPFATLAAMSRAVLGLHYPSDVAAGALLGFALCRHAVAAAVRLMARDALARPRKRAAEKIDDLVGKRPR